MIKWFRRRFRGRTTLILIPPSAQQVNRFMVSPGLIMTGFVLVLSFLVLTGAVGYLYFNGQAEIRNVKALQDDNRQKQETIASLSREIERIEIEQQSLAFKQQELRRMMGLEPDENYEKESLPYGQGGPDEIGDDGDIGDSMETVVKIEDLKEKYYNQKTVLDELIARVGKNQDYFRSIPNSWPVKGELTSTFGYRQCPFGGNRETFHNGIDIACDTGTKVTAAADGVVTQAGWEGVYGRVIVVDHGYGIKTLYGHNNSLSVQVGDKVCKGQLIALSGNSGRSTGPHLHYTVMRYGQAIDPMLYLPRSE